MLGGTAHRGWRFCWVCRHNGSGSITPGAPLVIPFRPKSPRGNLLSGDDVAPGRCDAQVMSSQRPGAATYRLVLRGELGDQFGVFFAGMRMSREYGMTVLTGLVADQAHLVGIIDRTQELGLELISVGPLDEAPGSLAEQG
jgi:hypothetical protein